MRSGSGDVQLDSDISSTTPIWSSSANNYDFDSYPNQHNGMSASSSCYMSVRKSNASPSAIDWLRSYYYWSNTAETSTSCPCKPAPTKFWLDSVYDAGVNG